MSEMCDDLCIALRQVQQLRNETPEILLTYLTLLCNVSVEEKQRSAFLSFLARSSVDSNNSHCSSDVPHAINLALGYIVPINGYILPSLILLTIINNSLICIVLLKTQLRSTTNALFVAMALSDMMTGLFPLPMFLYFYATERVHEWIPYNWCFPLFVLEDYIPLIFHTASIWLTTALAVQRYICVCHPFKARTWCTARNVAVGTCAIFFIATIVQVPRFFENDIVETWRRSRINPSLMVPACVLIVPQHLETNFNILFNLYYWFRIIFMNLIPCLSLVILNTLLILAMRQATKRRIELLRQNMTSESQQLKETNSTTMMLVTVMVVFLLVELPTAVVMTLMIVTVSFQINFFQPEIYLVLFLFSNLFILLSYPLNFFIYCSMSKQFRETFKSLFTCNKTT